MEDVAIIGVQVVVDRSLEVCIGSFFDLPDVVESILREIVPPEVLLLIYRRLPQTMIASEP